MTILSLENRVSYVAVGGETAFSFNFDIESADLEFWQTAENIIEVLILDSAGIETKLVHNTDFTVDTVQSIVNLVVPAIAGDKYTILLDAQPIQNYTYDAGTTFRAKSHEAALDHLSRSMITLKDTIKRIPVLIKSVAEQDLLNPAGKAGQVVAVASTEDRYELSDISNLAEGSGTPGKIPAWKTTKVLEDSNISVANPTTHELIISLGSAQQGQVVDLSVSGNTVTLAPRDSGNVLLSDPVAGRVTEVVGADHIKPSNATFLNTTDHVAEYDIGSSLAGQLMYVQEVATGLPGEAPTLKLRPVTHISTTPAVTWLEKDVGVWRGLTGGSGTANLMFYDTASDVTANLTHSTASDITTTLHANVSQPGAASVTAQYDGAGNLRVDFTDSNESTISVEGTVVPDGIAYFAGHGASDRTVVMRSMQSAKISGTTLSGADIGELEVSKFTSTATVVTDVAGVVTLDLNVSSVFFIYLDKNITVNLVTPTVSSSTYIPFSVALVKQVAGDHIITWNASFKWIFGIPYTGASLLVNSHTELMMRWFSSGSGRTECYVASENIAIDNSIVVIGSGFEANQLAYFTSPSGRFISNMITAKVTGTSLSGAVIGELDTYHESVPAETVLTPAAGTITIDFNLGESFTFSHDQDLAVVVDVTNLNRNYYYEALLRRVKDNTATSHALTFGSAFMREGGTDFVLKDDANTEDVFMLVYQKESAKPFVYSYIVQPVTA